MKTTIHIIPKVLIKLLAMAIAPVIRVMIAIYHIFTFVMSYGCLGLSLICLFATVMEFITVGITQESIAYIVTAFIGFAVRWGVIHAASILYWLQNTVEYYAKEPICRDNYYESGNYYSYL